jgi:hypothetical protein
MRKIALALAFIFGLANGVAAQAPSPVPALPDSPRLTTYSIAGTTCACAVGFALYGSGNDVDEWIQVYVNNVAYKSTDPVFGWSLSSPSGSLSTLPRPITNAILTFNTVQTGAVVILGFERPRRLTQFPENRGVAARDINQAVTDAVAVQRELWDKTNRSIVGQPGEVITPLPPAASRGGYFFCWDPSGLIPTTCQALATPGTITVPGSSINGDAVCFSGTTGKSLADCGWGIGGAPSLGYVPMGLGTGTSTWTSPSSWLDTAYCNTVGYLIVRWTGAWTCSKAVALNPVWLGADPSGVSDSTTAWQAALTAVAGGGSVLMPCGTFVISSATSFTVASGQNVSVAGQGLCTILAFRGTNATTVTLASVFSTINWGHMRLTTNAAGTYTGLALSMNSNPTPLYSVHHMLQDMQFTGSDYQTTQTNYWGTSLSLSGLSNVSIDTVATIGVAQAGTGVFIQGYIAGGGYSTVINFSKFISVYNNMGIFWSSFVQGITVTGSNFQSNNYGIRDGAGTGLSQLSVDNSQFGDNHVAGILATNLVGELAVGTSLFELNAGQVGIEGTGYDFKVVGNSFLAGNAGSNIGVGIALVDTNAFGTIANNSFANLADGINSATASISVMITRNNHVGTTVMYNFAGSASNLIVDDNQPTAVGSLPTCNTIIQGSMMTVLDNATGASYHGGVTGSGSGWTRVFCPPSGGWVQD